MSEVVSASSKSSVDHRENVLSVEDSSISCDDLDLASCKSELDRVSVELADSKKMIQKLQLTLAGSENEKKIIIKQANDDVTFALQSIVKDLSEIVDVFYLAVDSVDQKSLEESPKMRSFFEGVDMTKKSLMSVFAKYGVERVFPLGEQFDSSKHQAVSMVKGDEDSGVVVAVIKSGYILNGRLLSPALVNVSSGRDS